MRIAALGISPEPLPLLPVDFATGDASVRLQEAAMIRKLKSGQYRLYSRKKDDKTGKRRNLGTFDTREAAQKHEREVQYFKRH